MTVAVRSPRAAASVWLAGDRAAQARFPPRPAGQDWPATRTGRDQAEDVPGPAGRYQAGLGLLLDWLEGQDGDSWQQRWLASGAEEAGTTWWQLPARRAGSRYLPGMRRFGALTAALIAVIAGDVVRASLAWLVAAGCDAELARAMAAIRDPRGFARLAELCEAGPAGPVPKPARTHTLRRAAVIVAAKGGMLDGIVVGDPLELLDTEADVLGAARPEGAASYRLLRQLGTFGPDAPGRLRELRTAGQRTPEEMIDRHNLACRPIRDLLVDYLRGTPARDGLRQPGTASPQAGHVLGGSGGPPSRHRQPAPQCRSRRRVEAAAADQAQDDHHRRRHQDRDRHRADLPPRVPHTGPGVLPRPGPVGRRGPRPVGTLGRAVPRRARRDRPGQGPAAPQVADGRPDPRTAPGPAGLVRSAARQHADAAALLHTALAARPGEIITAGGQVLARAGTTRTSAGVWAEDLATGTRHNLTSEEDRAFWAWAAIEVLRATEVRAEELVQISHHSLVQYRLPSTGELVPLLQIAPSKTDAERLLVVSPELDSSRAVRDFQTITSWPPP